MKNILTVDVEDWFHICDIEHILPRSDWDQCESRVLQNVERILSLLGRHSVRATFFVLGYVAERTPAVVEMIRKEGHEIASHGYGHVQAYKQNRDEFLLDLLRSKDLLEEMTGEKVIGYRAPQWSICGALEQAEFAETGFVAKAGRGKRDSHWAFDLLMQSGFLYDSSVAPLRFIGIPDAATIPYAVSSPYGVIKEFPPLVMPSPFGNLPIGGGWGLRIFPYQSIKSRITHLNKEGNPALVFLHPSDFDPHLPKVDLPMMKRFVCRGKIRTTEERMTRLLNDFEFSTVREVLLVQEYVEKDLSNPPIPPFSKGG